jgi:hypothetical protein
MHMVLEMCHEHEYRFSPTLLYDFMHLQIISDIYEKKYLGWNKIVKYSIHIYNYVKL